MNRLYNSWIKCDKILDGLKTDSWISLVSNLLGLVEVIYLNQPFRTSSAEIRETKDLGQKVTALSCSTCGKNNPIESKFCNNCGSSLSPSCSNCGHSNPPGALFCGRCGSKLAG